MELTVSSDARAIGVRNPVLALIENVSMHAETPQAILTAADKILAEIGKNLESHLTLTKAEGYRAIFAALGYSNIEPAGERLVRSFLEKGFKSYGAVIDAYNLVALRHAAGIGMHDAAKINGSIHVSRACGGEHITPLFRPKPKSIQEGDIIYSDESGAIAWLGKRDVDSDFHKLDQNTQSLAIVILGNEQTTTEDNAEIAEQIFSAIATFSPSATLRLIEGRHASCVGLMSR